MGLLEKRRIAVGQLRARRGAKGFASDRVSGSASSPTARAEPRAKRCQAWKADFASVRACSSLSAQRRRMTG
jgi:hypothetical protein